MYCTYLPLLGFWKIREDEEVEALEAAGNPAPPPTWEVQKLGKYWDKPPTKWLAGFLPSTVSLISNLLLRLVINLSLPSTSQIMLVNSWPLLFLLHLGRLFSEWGWFEGSPFVIGVCYEKQVDSAAEPILMVCALYVALDGLTIIINGALKGCGRQMVQVGWGLVF